MNANDGALKKLINAKDAGYKAPFKPDSRRNNNRWSSSAGENIKYGNEQQ